MQNQRLSLSLLLAASVLLACVGCEDKSKWPYELGDARRGVAADSLAGSGQGDAGTLESWCLVDDERFSFFATSMHSLWTLSGSDLDDMDGGFGGDFGGLAGADGICQAIGAAAGHGHKTWRAFLSATDDGSGNPVHAIERIGEGPWHDANGRLVATGKAGLVSSHRPDGDPQTIYDLPDECGVPLSAIGDAHDIVTASDEQGRLHSSNPSSTCNDWTSADPSVGKKSSGSELMCGHSFPRFGSGQIGADGKVSGGEVVSGAHWLSDHGVPGCGKGAILVEGKGSGCIGCAGGYGAIYCFALTE